MVTRLAKLCGLSLLGLALSFAVNADHEKQYQQTCQQAVKKCKDTPTETCEDLGSTITVETRHCDVKYVKETVVEKIKQRKQWEDGHRETVPHCPKQIKCGKQAHKWNKEPSQKQQDSKQCEDMQTEEFFTEEPQETFHEKICQYDNETYLVRTTVKRYKTCHTYQDDDVVEQIAPQKQIKK